MEAPGGGAGGSIWITAASMTGDGLIEAAGGVSYRQGGGGAVAIEYGTSAGTALTRVNAKGGSGGSAAVNGGAGTVVLKGPGSTHGTLRVDNLGTTGQQTVLPSLGFGTAQPETSGATLATGRGATIPPYFAGHWVEITRGGSPLGTWRIGTIADQTVTLEPNSAETIALRGGDLWQGVYRFDAVEVNGNAVLRSEDPIRVPTVNLSGPTAAGSYTEVTTPLVAEAVSVTGNVSIPGITATNLTVKTGARLTHSAMTATQARSLDLKVTGTLTIEDGGSIDVTGRGYPGRVDVPGSDGAVSPTDSAGSHVGTGGLAGQLGGYADVRERREAAGSWQRRLERRSEAWRRSHPDRGRDVGVGRGDGEDRRERRWRLLERWSRRLDLDHGDVDDGRRTDRGGWRRELPARRRRSGGDRIRHVGGHGADAGECKGWFGRQRSGERWSGHGGPEGTRFDARDAASRQPRDDGTADGAAKPGIRNRPARDERERRSPQVVARRSPVLRRALGGDHARRSPLGTWRIGTIADQTVTLEPNSAETIALRGGDLWQGVYRFDAVEVNGNAVLRSEDPIRVPTVNLSGPTAAGSYTEVRTPLVAETVSVTGNVSIPGSPRPT
ncbi:MAG: hypothetical protein IPN83_05930 [Holophagales bacterium]|nr:hypothetical protein [Holophagales bacterium]